LQLGTWWLLLFRRRTRCDSAKCSWGCRIERLVSDLCSVG
jgi:hypothetical protein